jgi:16S rRNA processing protein RimM
VRLALEGVGTREAAEALRGRLVFGRAEDLPALPEGEHYWYELVGCDLETEDGRRVGRIREIWETGAHDVFVVERNDGATCLVPTARELLREIDVEARRVVVEDLPGLFEPVDRAGRVESRGR